MSIKAMKLSMEEAVKKALDVGCGPYYQVFEPEVVAVTRLDTRDDVGAHIARSLESADIRPGDYDIIYASHLLEHYCDPAVALRRLWSWVGEGGELRVAVPSLEWAAAQIVNGIFDDSVLRCIYGVTNALGARWKMDFHRTGFIFASFKSLLEEICVGAKSVEVSCWRNSLWAKVQR